MGNRREKGQAVVEYILMVSMVLIVVTLIATTFRSTLRTFWRALNNEVCAPCKQCPNGCNPPH